MTKKLLGLSLLAMLLLIGSAIAADTSYFWYGGTFDGVGNWNDTIKARINANIDVPCYITSMDPCWVGGLHLPLGVNTAYIDGIPKPLCSILPPINGYPLPGPPYNWDEFSFLDTFEISPPNPAGWRSRSFFGLAETGNDRNAGYAYHWHATGTDLELQNSYLE